MRSPHPEAAPGRIQMKIGIAQSTELAEKFKYQAFFLVGPTAAGKTAVAHWLAEHHAFDILSADSMLVYRGMDIGTAKPTAEERARVRYWGLDLVAPGERFSVGDYQAAALAALRAAAAAGRRLIVVGGTGLYITCLIAGLDPRPPRNPALRDRAERLLAARGIDALREWLGRLAPARLQALADPLNPRRLIRAIELAAAGVAPPDKPAGALRARPRIPGLRLSMDALDALIQERVRKMYAAGLIEEVRRLLAQGLAAAPTASQAIGYAEAMEVIGGRRTREAAMAATVLRTRRLARRQMTWFRHQASVDWLEIAAALPVAERAARVLEYWQTHGPTPIAGDDAGILAPDEHGLARMKN